MAEIAFNCPQCGHQYQFAADLAGKRGRCKACQAVFRIPDLPTARPTAVAIAPASAARPAAAPPPAEDGKVAFHCPTCGHGYRLDARLAGKQGRCTSCLGIFTIPARSTPASPSSSSRPRGPEADRSAPPHPRPAGGRTGPPAPATAAGESGWWELDSSETIPATTAPSVAGRPRTAPAVTAARPAVSPGEWTPVVDDDDGPIVTAKPVRPKWVLYAAVGVGVIVGGVAFAVTSNLVSNALKPASPPVGEPPRGQPPQAAVAAADEADDETEAEGNPPGPEPGPPLAGAAGQHREAVDAVTRAYQKLADAYARIRDPDSIAEGSGPIALAVAELRAAARRGKALPSLSPIDRRALIREAGPPLLRAVDRVLLELRRLQATPGLRSEFDRLIAAYTRTREEIRREVDRS